MADLSTFANLPESVREHPVAKALMFAYQHKGGRTTKDAIDYARKTLDGPKLPAEGTFKWWDAKLKGKYHTVVPADWARPAGAGAVYPQREVERGALKEIRRLGDSVERTSETAARPPPRGDAVHDRAPLHAMHEPQNALPAPHLSARDGHSSDIREFIQRFQDFIRQGAIDPYEQLPFPRIAWIETVPPEPTAGNDPDPVGRIEVTQDGYRDSLFSDTESHVKLLDLPPEESPFSLYRYLVSLQARAKRLRDFIWQDTERVVFRWRSQLVRTLRLSGVWRDTEEVAAGSAMSVEGIVLAIMSAATEIAERGTLSEERSILKPTREWNAICIGGYIILVNPDPAAFEGIPEDLQVEWCRFVREATARLLRRVRRYIAFAEAHAKTKGGLLAALGALVLYDDYPGPCRFRVRENGVEHHAN